jgi:osmoprotectant transport system permease protein
VFPSLGFENTFAIVIRGETARQYNLKTLSQVAKYTPNWQAGFGYEFLEREERLQGISEDLWPNFCPTPKVMDLGLMYRALAAQTSGFSGRKFHRWLNSRAEI